LVSLPSKALFHSEKKKESQVKNFFVADDLTDFI